MIDPEAEAWVPFDGGSSFDRARSSLLYARLSPVAGVDAATREVQALFPEMERDRALRLDTSQPARVVPLTDVIVGDVRSPLLFVAAAVGLLVMLTAANVGTLLLGRQVARRRDVAVRLALGASRVRLARETLVENVILAGGGGVLGLSLARVMLPGLIGLLPREMPRLSEVAIDPLVVAAVLFLTVCAVVAFAVAPVLATTRMNVQPLLRRGGQTEGRGSRAALDVLVVAQLALAIVLGLAATLTGRSLWRLQHVNPGFSPESVLTLRVQPAGERYRASGRTLVYYRSVTDRIAVLPGIEKVGLINHLPLSGYSWMTTFVPEGRGSGATASAPRIGWRMVDGDVLRRDADSASSGPPLPLDRRRSSPSRDGDQ